MQMRFNTLKFLKTKKNNSKIQSMSDDLLFIRQMETVFGNLFSKDPVNSYYLNRAQKEFLNEKSF